MSLVLMEFGDFPMMRKMLRTLQAAGRGGPAAKGPGDVK